MQPPTHIAISSIVDQAAKSIGLPLNLKGVILGGLAPDIDWLFVPFLPRNFIHRTVFHSLLWVVTVALIGRKKYGGLSVALGGIAHLAADELNSCDSRRQHWPRQRWFFPYGITKPPFKRCLVDVGFIRGTRLRRDIIIELPIIAFALWLAWRNKK